MYDIRYDLELDVGKATVRTIPCVCSFCTEQLDLPWDKKGTRNKSKEV